MWNKTDTLALIGARRDVYRFLSGLYLMEVDEKQLAALKKLVFPAVTGDSEADLDLRQGYELLQEAVRKTGEEDLDELAADYAKVFLAAGAADGKAAFPYASVYLDRKQSVGGDMDQKMKALYLARGRRPDPDSYRTTHDHLGLMLEYMAVLCEEQYEAADTEDLPRLKTLFDEQRDFLKKDLLSWVYSFTADVIRYAQPGFYPGAALITNGFLRKENEFLEEAGLWDIV